ncbi:hypothetical protein QQF64_012977 [Cirrhinus molitorella]|uniref:Immunoglobulin domain-containing protein n=1 Tax=Cirrhinus molitorella TaxID=172907 RepID=A0ABR3LPU6_9TELE
MAGGLNLLLLFCFVISSGTLSVGTNTINVAGEKGGNTSLQCQFESKKISYTVLNSLSENIDVCPTEECSGRVFKQGSCNIIIKDLRFSDAGTYMLHIYYHNDQGELERQVRTYKLHIHDEISVKIGEELKLDVLLPNADKVQHQSRRSTKWKEDWSRTDGLQREQMTISDRNLIINEFTARDAGTYRVLGSEGEIMITVIVEEPKETMDNTDVVISNDTIYSILTWIVIAGLHAMALVMYVVPCVKKHQWLSKERVKIILMNWPQCKEM